jgi:hypothetical protein
MTEVKTVPVPLALRNLIESNNQLLKNYQTELTSKVLSANEEIMRMLGLNPNDGWKLDINTFTYVKVEEPTVNDTPIS